MGEVIKVPFVGADRSTFRAYHEQQRRMREAKERGEDIDALTARKMAEHAAKLTRDRERARDKREATATEQRRALRPGEIDPRVAYLLKELAGEFEVEVEQLVAKGNSHESPALRNARATAVWLLKRATGRCPREVAVMANRRDETTVTAYVRRVEALRNDYPTYRELTDRLLGAALGRAWNEKVAL